MGERIWTLTWASQYAPGNRSKDDVPLEGGVYGNLCGITVQGLQVGVLLGHNVTQYWVLTPSIKVIEIIENTELSTALTS